MNCGEENKTTEVQAGVRLQEIHPARPVLIFIYIIASGLRHL